MAAKLHYRDGGVWRAAAALHYKDAGIWRNLTSAWYRDGGVWRQVFAAFSIVNPLAGGTYIDGDVAPGSVSCTMSVGSDGYIGFSGVAAGDLGGQLWGTPQTAGVGVGYWVRVTLTSGTFSSSAGSGWLQLSTTRHWTRNRPTSGIGTTSCTCTVEIATDSGGASIVTSGSFTLRATLS